MSIVVMDSVAVNDIDDVEDADGYEMHSAIMEISEYHSGLSIVQDRSQKSSSGVWRHFGAIKNDTYVDQRHVYCIHCFENKKIKKYQKSTSTGNLSKHLKRQHSISLEQTFVIKKENDSSIVRIAKAGQSNGEFERILSSIEQLDTEDGNVEEFLIHDINEILIQEVEKRPILYNPAICQEKGQKHQIRRQLWNEVYESLNHLIPYEKLPKIWKNIRDRYYKIKRGMENTQMDGIGIRPKYRYYDLLRFLDHSNEKAIKKELNCTSPNSAKSQMVENYADEFLINPEHQDYISTDSSNAHEFEDENLCVPAKKVKLSHDDVQTHSQLENQYDAEQREDPQQFNQLQVTSTDLRTFQQVQVQVQIPSELSENLMVNQEPVNQSSETQTQNQIQCEPQTQNSNRKSDECEIFGNFVAEVMRNMTKSQSRKLQTKILGLIADCEDNN